MARVRVEHYWDPYGNEFETYIDDDSIEYRYKRAKGEEKWTPLPFNRVKKIGSEGVIPPWYADVQKHQHIWPQEAKEVVYNTFSRIWGPGYSRDIYHDYWDTSEDGSWIIRRDPDMPREFAYDTPWHHMYHSEGDGFELFELNGGAFGEPERISTYIPKTIRKKIFYPDNPGKLTEDDLEMLDLDQILNMRKYIFTKRESPDVPLSEISAYDIDLIDNHLEKKYFVYPNDNLDPWNKIPTPEPGPEPDPDLIKLSITIKNLDADPGSVWIRFRASNGFDSGQIYDNYDNSGIYTKYLPKGIGITVSMINANYRPSTITKNGKVIYNYPDINKDDVIDGSGDYGYIYAGTEFLDFTEDTNLEFKFILKQ